MEATTSLHDFFTEHLHLLAQVIQQGYQSPTINLPKLDPLTTESRISSTINTDKTNLELECDSIRVLGLSSLSQDCHVGVGTRSWIKDKSEWGRVYCSFRNASFHCAGLS